MFLMYRDLDSQIQSSLITEYKLYNQELNLFEHKKKNSRYTEVQKKFYLKLLNSN